MTGYITPNQAAMQKKRGRPSQRIEAESVPAAMPAAMPVPTPAFIDEPPLPEIWVKMRAKYNPGPGIVYINENGEKETFPNFAPSDEAERFRRRLKVGALVLLPIAEARRLLNSGYAEMWVPGT